MNRQERLAQSCAVAALEGYEARLARGRGPHVPTADEAARADSRGGLDALAYRNGWNRASAKIEREGKNNG